jgi:hypothetical protein
MKWISLLSIVKQSSARDAAPKPIFDECRGDKPGNSPSSVSAPAAIASLNARGKRRQKSTAKANPANFQSLFAERNTSSEKYFALQVVVPLHVAKRLEKRESFFLRVFKTFVSPFHMPNKRAADKTQIGFYVSRAIYKQAVKLAEQKGVSISKLMVLLLTEATIDVPLTTEDYAQIAKEAAEYESGLRKNKRKA